MGIKNPDQIVRFTLYESEHTDHLRIIYKRRKGSWLPESRKYKYPRVRKVRPVGGRAWSAEYYYESSPFLISAVAELNAIVGNQRSIVETKEIIAEEITHLEEEIAERISHIKSLVDSIE